MNLIKRDILKIISILLIILTFLAILWMTFCSKNLSQIVLNEHWDIQVNQTNYQDVSLSSFSFPIMGDGDTIHMETDLPELTNHQVLSLMLHHSACVVSINDQEIYRFGYEKYAKDILLGSGYHRINLPSGRPGQKLSIDILSTEKNNFSYLDIPTITDGTLVIRNYILENSTVIAVCIFLVCFGIILFLLSLLFSLQYKQFRRLLYISIFSVFMGMWMICCYRLIQIFITNTTINCLLEYFFLFTAHIPIVYYFRDLNQHHPTEKKALSFLIYINYAFILFSFGMQFLNVFHVTDTLMFFHGILCIEVVVMLTIAFRHFNKKNMEDKFIFIGVIILVLTVFVDMIRFQFETYHSPLLHNSNASIMPTGILLFILFLLISYFSYLKQEITSLKEQEVLKKLAYEDYLTGLNNRTKIEILMDELEKENNTTFSIISLDLNALKSINDNLGHEFGDIYLKNFAACLKEFWQPYGECGRMGGDEFIVLLQNTSVEQGTLYLQEFSDFLKRFSMQQKTLPESRDYPECCELSVSYGIAAYGEKRRYTPKSVYQLADIRMYEMKSIYHLSNDKI